MTATKVTLAVALLASVATVTLVSTSAPGLAQSQPNYGPSRNAGGDSYGEPYSGSAQARRQSGGW